METLIKIQSIIMEIERLTLSVEYRSNFEYINEHHLIVKSFCWRQSAALHNVLEGGNGYIINQIHNSSLEIFAI